MGPVLINYDLAKGQDYSGVLDYIEKHDHIQLGESCYVIDTPKLIGDVLNDLLNVAPPNAKIFVTEVPALFVMSDPLADEAAWLRERVT